MVILAMSKNGTRDNPKGGGGGGGELQQPLPPPLLRERAQLWNSLPSGCQDSKSVNSFNPILPRAWARGGWGGGGVLVGKCLRPIAPKRVNKFGKK